MKFKEFEKLINEEIVKRGYNKRENDSFYEIKNLVEYLVRELIKEKLNDEYFTQCYPRYYNGTTNNIYIYPSPEYKKQPDDLRIYMDSVYPRNEEICEIKIHKTIANQYYRWNRKITHWKVVKVTVKALTEYSTFEEAYNSNQAEYDKRYDEALEKAKKSKEESDRKDIEYAEKATKEALAILDYIKANKLDKDEFVEMAKKYDRYVEYFNKVVNG